MPEYVDVIVPRGGRGLIERISEDARVSVIKHLDGICHVYIDSAADVEKAHKIAFNSKTHRYGVCNAMETLLVHADISQTVLPKLIADYKKKGVELRGCERVQAFDADIKAASDADWDTEYLAPILAIKLVSGFDEAVDHINRHSSQHTESIVTENYSLAQRFLVEVDSASVMINAYSQRSCLACQVSFGSPSVS